jgi:hypothetical protein
VALIYEHSEYQSQLERKCSLNLYLLVWFRNTMYALLITVDAAVLLLGIGSGILRKWGGFGVFKPPTKIPKALQNRAKLNPIVKTVKNC